MTTCDVCKKQVTNECDSFVACLKCNFDVCTSCLTTSVRGTSAVDNKAMKHEYIDQDVFISWI